MGQWRLKVAKGCCILPPAGTAVIKSGTIIIPGKEIEVDGKTYPPLSKQQIEGHLASGYLIDVSPTEAPTPDDANELVENAPGASNPPPIKLGNDLEEKDGIRTSVRASAPVKQVTSLWTFNPEALADKSLDQLNVMIFELDPRVAAMETIEEARAFLSQDFARAGGEVTVEQGEKSDPDSQVATS